MLHGLIGDPRMFRERIQELEQQNAVLVKALKVAFEIIDDDYGHGIANGYWPDTAPLYEQVKQALALVEGDKA